MNGPRSKSTDAPKADAGQGQDSPGASLAASFEADAERLREDRPTQEDLTAAFGYWIGYPCFLEWISCAAWPAEAKTRARHALDAAHHAATHALMHAAGRAGLDPHALYECGRATEEVYRADPDKLYRRGAYDTWPECMGPWRYELPDGQQAALRNGEAAFVRLAVALDIEEARGGATTGMRQQVQDELLRMRKSGQKCPTVREYQDHHEKRFGRKPSTSTVNVAINASPTLKGWRSMTKNGAEHLRQTTDERDIALARLMEEAGPELRGAINGRSEEERYWLAGIYDKMGPASKAQLTERAEQEGDADTLVGLILKQGKDAGFDRKDPLR